jgi:hypothetical protein
LATDACVVSLGTTSLDKMRTLATQGVHLFVQSCAKSLEWLLMLNHPMDLMQL